jgi:hypothetical protein
VIHTCYVKSSLRVIASDAGAACKPKENALDIYSKAGADAAFLGKTAKAADADTVDGLDSTQARGGPQGRQDRSVPQARRDPV